MREKPEPVTKVRFGKREAQIPLRKRRREALNRLMEILTELEGKTVHIGWCGGNRCHFWLNNLKLERVKVEALNGGDDLPSVIILWGSRGASVRIFTEQAIALRRQEYLGYTLWRSWGTSFLDVRIMVRSISSWISLIVG